LSSSGVGGGGLEKIPPKHPNPPPAKRPVPINPPKGLVAHPLQILNRKGGNQLLPKLREGGEFGIPIEEAGGLAEVTAPFCGTFCDSVPFLRRKLPLPLGKFRQAETLPVPRFRQRPRGAGGLTGMTALGTGYTDKFSHFYGYSFCRVKASFRLFLRQVLLSNVAGVQPAKAANPEPED